MLAAALVTGMLSVGPAAAQPPELAQPWPALEAVAAMQGRAVTFPSHSPFTLTDAGPERDPRTTAQGMLFMPEGASSRTPVPAVVMLHGASGVQSARGPTYARQLAAMGVAALVVDVFGARRHLATGFTERLLNITEAMYLADAYAGLRLLSAMPEVDPDRIALLGFSYGGMAAVYAAYALVAERFATGAERFAAHVAFYAPCIADFQDPRATGAPVLMLYGSADALVDGERCQAVAEALRRGGAPVEIVVYPGAVHQWDGAWGRRRMGRNLAACRFVVAPDGAVREGRLGLSMPSPFMRKVALALCVDDSGYMLGRDDAVRHQSNRDLGRFLQHAFAEPS